MEPEPEPIPELINDADDGCIKKLLYDELCSRDEDRVAQGLTTLVNMCHDDNDLNAGEHCRLIGKFGGEAIVVFVMEQNLQHAQIVSHACGFLSNYIPQNGSRAEEIYRLGGIALVVKAMQAFPNHGCLQRCAVAVLNNVLVHLEKELVQEIVKTNGLSAVTMAIKNFPDVVDLQRRACGGLFGVSKVKENRSLIIKAGGFVAVAAAYVLDALKDE